MRTNKADYLYVLKELGDDPAVWALECSPKTTQLPFIRNTGVMYLEMKPEVSEAEAIEIENLLNERVSCIKIID